jgi:hypothetical protein
MEYSKVGVLEIDIHYSNTPSLQYSKVIFDV